MTHANKRVIIALSLAFALHASLFAFGGGSKSRPRLRVIERVPRRVNIRLCRRGTLKSDKKSAATPVAASRMIKTKPGDTGDSPPVAVPRAIDGPEQTTVMQMPAAVLVKEPQAESASEPEGRSEEKPGSDGDETFVPTVLARPFYRRNPPPRYPARARIMRWQGTVHILTGVNVSGRVERAEILRSSGYPSLDRAALNAVRSWIFIPARRGSAAIPCEVTVPVRFVLK